MQLTGKEFELLKVLVANEGKVVLREKLMRDVWDSAWYGSTKTLDMHISVLAGSSATTRRTRATSPPSEGSASASTPRRTEGGVRRLLVVTVAQAVAITAVLVGVPSAPC